MSNLKSKRPSEDPSLMNSWTSSVQPRRLEKRDDDLFATGWAQIVYPSCDICGANAKWRHPKGGLRCNVCPRPESGGT